MAINKVIYGGSVLLDLTGDTVTAEQLAQGVTAHDKSGAQITGTSTKDSDTQDATAAESEILSGKTAYARGAKLTGKMTNNGAVALKITTKAQKATIAQGFHDGSGTAEIDATEQAKIIPDNIRQGITILGVAGEMTGTEDVVAQAKTATPTTSTQTVLPDSGYNYLSQVTVNAIPYVESDNSAGGKTATIG